VAPQLEASWAPGSEPYLRALVSHLPDGVIVITSDGSIRFSNGLALLGYDHESVLGRNALSFIHPDDAERVVAELAEAVAGKRGLESPLQIRAQHARGDWRTLEVVAANLLDDPDVEGIVVNVRDVTERERIREQAMFQASLLEQVPAAMLVTDLEAKIVYWNEQAEQLLGWTAGEVMGRDAREFHDANDPAGMKAAMVALAQGDPYEADYEVTRKDGRRVPVRVRLSIVHGTDGSPSGVAMVSVDISDQLRVQRELETRSAQQAALAALSTRALAGADTGDLLQHAAELVADTLGTASAVAVEYTTDGTAARHGAVGPAAELVNDAARADDPSAWMTWLATDGASSASVPIEGQDGPLGVLAAVADGPRLFGRDDLSFLQTTANVLAAAIDRGRVAERMRHQALHDALTGLPNRTLFLDRLRHAIRRGHRHPNEQLALLFIDLDRFKLVNDTLGHRAGDELLIEAARQLTRAVREGDTVARFGGDEFAVLCEDVGGIEQAGAVADRIAKWLGRPLATSGREVYLTASIGIALPTEPDPDPDDLLRDADVAMYLAKERGRARWELFDGAMRERTVTRVQVEHELRRGVQRGEILAYFQPQVALATGRVVAFEALARWEHPDRGRLGPEEFIEVAEEAGLTSAISGRIVDESLYWLERWRRLVPDLRVAINISPRELAEPDLFSRLRLQLREHRLPADVLTLEITETALLDDRDIVLDTLRQLRSIGVRIAIDDFGTGYSSLGYLTRFPVDELKVDRSFVHDVGIDTRRSAIVAAVVGMADALGLDVVAEGAERREQIEELRGVGCDTAQGTYWSAPLAGEAVAEWLASLHGDPPHASVA
jgi:diguanylate cyclase (GGDEF)-like protein/PAS domain S-box-containing protein